MGRWSFLLGAVGLLSVAGCAIPGMQNLGQHSPSHAIPDVSSQSLIPSVTSSKTKDPDLAPDKAAKLCLATGEELEKNGHVDQAINQYEMALKHQPQMTVAMKKMAGCYAQQRKFDLAVAQYQKALTASPKDPDLLNDLGYTYYEMEDYASAEKYLRQAITLRQNHQRAYGNLGLVLGRQQKWRESLEAFKKAGPPATAQANLAAMYLAAGQHEEARRSCNIALGIDPQLKTAKEILAKLDSLPKDQKTVLQAEAKLSQKEEGSPAVASTDVSRAVQLQKPVRASKPTENLEFRPVK